MPRLTRRAALAGLMASGLTASPALAAPKARLIDGRWSRFGSGSGPDHGAWDAILARHRRMGPDGIARFDYARADRAAVRAYLGALSATDPASLSSAAAFAYYVNLYNALTVDVVLGTWPVGSIREIGGNLIAPGPWRQKLVNVAGQSLSLDDIEHGILRPVWRDPRVHYAVNCASLGCPDLAPRAYTAGRLGAMLDQGARAYVNHPRGTQVTDGRLQVSSIYQWFKEDFGGTDAGVIAHLRRYAEPQLASQLGGIARISADRYDWRINA
ncbi:DUF547 domain-containing protein [Halovulum sp. GXIMD14794]